MLPPPGTVAPPGNAAFRRLTASQYDNVMRTLLGDVALPARLPELELPGEEVFAAVASGVLGFTDQETAALHENALAASDAALADDKRVQALLGCAPARPDDDCVRGFINSFGQRAFRRPLSAAERDRYLGVARSVAAGLGGTRAGIRHALAAMLQSPKLLYLDFAGEPDPTRYGRRRYTSVEMASRLAFALTDGPPDQVLLAAGIRGDLTSVAAVRDHAARLGATPAGRGLFASRFLPAYFHVDGVANLGKSRALFPRWTSDLASAATGEVQRLFAALLEAGQPVARLLDNRITFANGPLAELYGVPSAAGADFSRVTLPADGGRTGILGTSAFLSAHARVDRTSPTLRGRFIASRLLCVQVPAPPPDADTGLSAAVEAGASLRRRLERHRADPACSGCHALMDPYGLMLERFDAIGAHRTTDDKIPIDDSGQVDGKTIAGLAGLAPVLAQSLEVSACVARNLFRFMAGHEETEAQAALAAVIAGKSTGALPDLALELAASDMFRTFSTDGGANP